MLVIEKDIEQYLKRTVEKLGGRCMKFISTYEVGMPDRLVILPDNKIAFVELKRPEGGKLSEIQKYQIDKLRDLGCHVYIIKNKGEADKMIEELING